MKKKIQKISFLFLFFILGGCSRYTEVNQLGIVEAISLVKENGKIKESISYVLPQKEENTSKNQYKILSKTGTSLLNAHLKIQEEDEKKIYFDQTQVVLCNQELLKEEGKNLIFFFLKNFRHPNFLFFLCEDCSTLLKKEKQKSFYEDLIQSQIGKEAITTFEDFASLYLDYDTTAYLPFIDKTNHIRLNALLQGKKEGSFIPYNKEEQATFFLLKNKSSTKEMTLKLEQKNYAILLKDIRSSIQIKQGVVRIKVTGSYQEKDFFPKNLQEKIPIQIQKNLTKQIQSFLKKEKGKKTDLLGIQNLFLRTTRNRKEAKKKKEKASYQIQIKFKKEGDFFDQL